MTWQKIKAFTTPNPAYVPPDAAEDWQPPLRTETGEALTQALIHFDGGAPAGVWRLLATLQGNTTGLEWWCTLPSGEPGPAGVLDPYEDYKIEVGSVDWKQTGAQLVVVAVAHRAVSDPARPSVYLQAILPVAVAPYPLGHPSLGAPTTEAALSPTGVPGPGPGPGPSPGGAVDLTGEAVAAVADAVGGEIQARMTSELGGQVQKKAKNGATEAIRAEVPGLLAAALPGGGALTGDQLAHAFWQEPFASKFRHLLKDAVYEVGRENSLWGLKP